MLVKHSSRLAQDAVFAVEQADEPLAIPLPSEADLAIADLSEKNRALRSELDTLRVQWRDELALAEQRGREAAARQHVSNDGKRLESLNAALGDARLTFEKHLLSAVRASALALATAVVEKFVALHDDDGDWLARVVERRVATLDRSMLVSLQVPTADVAEQLRGTLPAGTLIEPDHTLAAGTARLKLRLGAVEIDPEAGMARLLELLRQDDDA